MQQIRQDLKNVKRDSPDTTEKTCVEEIRTEQLASKETHNAKQPVEKGSDNKELPKLQLAAGFIGKLFGLGKNALTNIAGVVLLLLTIAAIGALFFPTTFPAKEIWDTIIPVISMILGYLFGKKGG